MQSDATTGSLAALIEQVGAGQPEAINLLLEKYRPYLRIRAQCAVRNAFPNRFDASDIVQQTCIEAYNGLDTFAGGNAKQFNGWINKILERNVLTFLRRHTAKKRDARREHAMMFDSDISLEWHPANPSGGGPASCCLQGEAALLLAETLSQLPEQQRMAVEMRFIEGCKIREVASQLEITSAAAAGLVARGIAKLRRSLPDSMMESY